MTSWTSSVGLKIAPLSVASGRYARGTVLSVASGRNARGTVLSVASGRCARGTVLSVASGRYARGTVLRYLAKLSQRPSDDLPDMTLIVRVRIDALNGVISKFGSGALSFPDTKALTTTIVDD